MSEALIFALTNPQYDKRLFIDLPVQYVKTTSSEHVVCINCFLFLRSKQFMYTTCSELVVFMYWTGKSMTYCGLVDARISASEKDLPVPDGLFCHNYRFFLIAVSKYVCGIWKKDGWLFTTNSISK